MSDTKNFRVTVMKKGNTTPHIYNIRAHSASEAKQIAKSMYPNDRIVAAVAT
jgi:hypothetical protein